jgi:hypothetical protein
MQTRTHVHLQTYIHRPYAYCPSEREREAPTCAQGFPVPSFCGKGDWEHDTEGHLDVDVIFHYSFFLSIKQMAENGTGLEYQKCFYFQFRHQLRQ